MLWGPRCAQGGQIGGARARRVVERLSRVRSPGIPGALGRPWWAWRRLIPELGREGGGDRRGSPEGVGSPGSQLAGRSATCVLRRGLSGRRARCDSGEEDTEDAGLEPRQRRRGARGRPAQAARGAGRGRRSRCGSPGGRPPPLRKRLVTAVRALSEAVCEDVAAVWEQQRHCPLTREPRSRLGQLWEPLCAAVQTVYTTANQAAYVFPAESWLVPAPPPAPGLQLGMEEKPGAPPGRDTGSPLPGSGARLPALGQAPALPQSWARSPGVRTQPRFGSDRR